MGESKLNNNPSPKLILPIVGKLEDERQKELRLAYSRLFFEILESRKQLVDKGNYYGI